MTSNRSSKRKPSQESTDKARRMENNDNNNPIESSFYKESLFLAKLEEVVAIIKNTVRKILISSTRRREELSSVEQNCAESLSSLSGNKLGRLHQICRIFGPNGITTTGIIVTTEDISMFAVGDTHPHRFIFNVLMAMYQIRHGIDLSVDSAIEIPVNRRRPSQNRVVARRSSPSRSSQPRSSRNSRRSVGPRTSPSRRASALQSRPRSNNLTISPHIPRPRVRENVLSTQESLVVTPDRKIHTKSITTSSRDTIKTRRLVVSQSKSRNGDSVFSMTSSIRKKNIASYVNNNTKPETTTKVDDDEDDDEDEDGNDDEDEDEDEDNYEDEDDYEEEDE